MLKECIDNLRKKAPLIHNITNYVTVNDVANIILACGASPIMADEVEEVEEITSICNGLNINIGTLNARTIPAMMAAGKKAQELNHVILLDPVGAGASTLRTNTALKLMEQIKFTVIRGNMSEIKALHQQGGDSRGVDVCEADKVTEDNLQETARFLQQFSRLHGCIVAVTGAIDLVTDGEQVYALRNGRPEMGQITGTGCQLSGLMTAYLAANPEKPLEAAVTAVAAMGAAGEAAFVHMKEYEGNSTYRNRIIDAICHMDGKTLEKLAKVERIV